MTLLVDELANELRHYRHSPMASAALAEHILAIPRIHDALAQWDRNPEGEKPQALSAEHDSPVAEGDAPNPTP